MAATYKSQTKTPHVWAHLIRRLIYSSSKGMAQSKARIVSIWILSNTLRFLAVVATSSFSRNTFTIKFLSIKSHLALFLLLKLLYFWLALASLYESYINYEKHLHLGGVKYFVLKFANTWVKKKVMCRASCEGA